MIFAIPPADPVSLPVVGSDHGFPVRRIFCVGKNYGAHVAEMGGDVNKSEPVFFTKFADHIVQSGDQITYPPNTNNLHYEVELVVAMGQSGIFGYGVGIDLTRRDVQTTAKNTGGPWDRAKNFPHSAPCSAITPKDAVKLGAASISLRKNDNLVQKSTLDKMIWSVEEIVSRLRDDMNLGPGDMVFTGTPEGVGAVNIGDTLEGSIDGLEDILVHFVK